MKTVIAAALFLSAAAPSWAQGADQEALKANHKKKLAAAFVTKAPWITDYDKAREESKKSGKAIFGYFTRSYAT